MPKTVIPNPVTDQLSSGNVTPPRRLEGRVAIVTGAGRGIGAAIARGFAEQGARVVIAELAVESADSLAASIRASGGDAIGVATDVADGDAVLQMVTRTVDAHGGIDILVNNAGILAGLRRRPFDEIPRAEWDRVIAVNLTGMWECAKAVAPLFRRALYGKIINVASETPLTGTPGVMHYVASKGGVIALTRALARELGPFGVCVNAIGPGFTLTDATAGDDWAEAHERTLGNRALGRNESPEDVVGAAIFLASGDSDFVTGQLLMVNGGSILH